MADRIIHGWTIDGHPIVRYDRAGKWYIEPTYGGPRRRVSVRLAAELAATADLHQPGGQIFDRLWARKKAL